MVQIIIRLVLWITTSWGLPLISCQYYTNSTITDPPIAKTPPISEDHRGGVIMPSMSFQCSRF